MEEWREGGREGGGRKGGRRVEGREGGGWKCGREEGGSVGGRDGGMKGKFLIDILYLSVPLPIFSPCIVMARVKGQC